MADGGGGVAGEPGASAGSAPVCNFVRKPPKTSGSAPTAPSGSTTTTTRRRPRGLAVQEGPVLRGKLVFSSADASSEPRRSSSSRPGRSILDSRATAHARDGDGVRPRRPAPSASASSSRPRSPSRRTPPGPPPPPAPRRGGVQGDPRLTRTTRAGFRRGAHGGSEKAGGSHGPLRASAHHPPLARFDYQPDISRTTRRRATAGMVIPAKFMHDRGDYKSGLADREGVGGGREGPQAAHCDGVAMGSDDEAADEEEDDDEEGPALRLLHLQAAFWFDPVVTKCKHYFCEHCALKGLFWRSSSSMNLWTCTTQRTKSASCANKPTLGIFNAAQEIRKKMAQDKKQQG
ncbi:hypothetical protein HU200_046920 [Digitaria exilis]|uniref:Uncharacterized protein n=1 Tax=Digitaria exilis TaxID=1010633 RepID=A0A835EAQ1_9POAL|nr:hypothetical protein HU200_046920 [Digitaria exilis]